MKTTKVVASSSNHNNNNNKQQQNRGDVNKQKEKRHGKEKHHHPPPLSPHHKQHQKPQLGEEKAEQLSTRICIKNLPPSLLVGKKKINATDSHAAQAELRRHLQHCFSLPQFADVVDMKMTDVKILEKRRMAFVGFANRQAAAKSVAYLHQSYYKTSRLVVEFATTTTTSKTKAKEQLQQEADEEKTKEKDKTTAVVVDRKKQEFLAVMGIATNQPSSSAAYHHTSSSSAEAKKAMSKEELKKTTPTRPFWANDDIMNAEAVSAVVATEEDANTADVNENANDDDIHENNNAKKDTTITNKNKKHDSGDNNYDHHGDDSSNSSSDNDDDDDDDDDNADPLKRTTTPAAKINTTNNKAQSDWDFLKSKTVDVQDLAAAQTTTSTTSHDDKDDSDTTEDDEAVPLAAAMEKETPISIRHDQSSTMDSSSSIEHDNDNDNNKNDGREKNKTNDDDDHEHDDENDNDTDNNEDPCRLFVRNLPFSTTRDALMQHFAGSSEKNNDADDAASAAGIVECHVPTQEHDHDHHHHNNDNNDGNDDDAQFYKCKGFAFVTFSNAHDALQARNRLDGRDFQGRLLHILPARKAPTAKQQDPNSTAVVDLDKLSYKQRQEYLRRQQENEQGGGGGTGWSASFVRGDAVVDTLASRLGLRKGDILNVKDASSASGRSLSAGDAAVRLALGETAVIEENRLYFSKHGIDMEALVSLKKPSATGRSDTSAGSRGKEKGGATTSGGGGDGDGIIERSKTSILVKNLPHNTTQEDLLKLFGSATTGSGGAGAGSGSDAQLPRILLPPSRTVAVVEYRTAKDAKSAFRRLAYRRFKNVPIYLEWAPLAAATAPNAAQTTTDPSAPSPIEGIDASATANNDNVDEDEVMDETGPTPTIYVKNLSFHTSEEDLHAVFSKHVKDVRAVRIPKKVAPVKRGGTTAASSSDQVRFLSMGYGFVEFGSRESVQKVMKSLQGTNVAGHALQLSVSKGTTSNATPSTLSSSKRNLSKLVVRNVPFQAARKELLQLFGSFGQLKKVRLPKKFDGNHRGFCFVEFVTRKDALTAVKALSRTHLYGRRLVIEWADQADEDESELDGLREKAKRDMDDHGQNDSRRNKKIRFE